MPIKKSRCLGSPAMHVSIFVRNAPQWSPWSAFWCGWGTIFGGLSRRGRGEDSGVEAQEPQRQGGYDVNIILEHRKHLNTGASPSLAEEQGSTDWTGHSGVRAPISTCVEETTLEQNGPLGRA